MSGLEMKYFVLKPGAKARDDPYARASQQAMAAYAEAIEDENEELARELTDWSTREVLTQARLPG